MMRVTAAEFLVGAAICCASHVAAQGCCSGGSGSPIAGGASQGVLSERQAELSLNGQYLSSSRFFTGDRDTAALFGELSGSYLYGRAAFGVTEKLTMSVEGGYFLRRQQVSADWLDTISSGGMADLILFPRYSVLSRNTEFTRTEITLGLGMKLPVGPCNDSTLVYRNPVTGRTYHTTSPPTVQPTNGANDFIFYSFVYRGYPETKFRVFTSMLYIRRGWNPLGQKFGDLATIGIFAGKNIGRKVSVTLQVRGEWSGRMSYDRQLDMLALYNIDVNSTGGRKIFFSPQVGLVLGDFMAYALYEMPLYQYLNGTQVGSGHMATAGISYRFFVKN